MAASADGGELDTQVILRKLLGAKDSPLGTLVNLREEQIVFLCQEVRVVLLSQSMLAQVSAPVNICGDTHGQFYDLLKLFEMGGHPPSSSYVSRVMLLYSKIIPFRYLFLGDYVDRAEMGLETICLLFAYKILYPENMYLLRGNHECASINRIYGFFDECNRWFFALCYFR